MAHSARVGERVRAAAAKRAAGPLDAPAPERAPGGKPRIRLFEALSETERMRVLGPGVRRRISRGEEVMPTDRRPAPLIILKGVFRIDLIVHSGQVIGMLSAKPGDSFGGYALIAGVEPY